MGKEKSENKPAWMPMPGETASAYAAFCLYRDLGVGRKLTMVQRIIEDMPAGGMNYGSILEWSQKFEWERRILDYEAKISEDRARAEAKEITKSIRRIQQERIARIDEGLRLVDRLRGRALEMLDAPLYREVRESREVTDDGDVMVQRVYEPVKWSMGDIPKFLQVAATLEKTVLTEPDQRHDDSITEEGALDAADAGINEWRRQKALQVAEIPTSPHSVSGSLTNPIEVRVGDIEDE